MVSTFGFERCDRGVGKFDYAGLSGTIVPLALNRFGIDPANASSVFLTTITDVVGFLAF